MLRGGACHWWIMSALGGMSVMLHGGDEDDGPVVMAMMAEVRRGGLCAHRGRNAQRKAQRKATASTALCCPLAVQKRAQPPVCFVCAHVCAHCMTGAARPAACVSEGGPRSVQLAHLVTRKHTRTGTHSMSHTRTHARTHTHNTHTHLRTHANNTHTVRAPFLHVRASRWAATCYSTPCPGACASWRAAYLQACWHPPSACPSPRLPTATHPRVTAPRPAPCSPARC